MARYAFVAVVRTVDPAEPHRWELTGDAWGVTSEVEVEDWMIDQWAAQKQIDLDHLQVVAFSAFETAEQ